MGMDAACATDATGLLSAMFAVSEAATSINIACRIKTPQANLDATVVSNGRRLKSKRFADYNTIPKNMAKIRASATMSAREKKQRLDALSGDGDWMKAACGNDLMNIVLGLSYLGTYFTALSQDCPTHREMDQDEKKGCAIDVLTVIGALSDLASDLTDAVMSCNEVVDNE